MADRKFQLGDIVFLKSDNAVRLVVTELLDNQNVICTWFNRQTSKIEDVEMSEYALGKVM